KRLITSALPYVNNIPHLGNLIQVLSADVFARFCRERGYETLYVCGTDEYGTATETRAREEGISPKELCTRYYKIHTDIYDWFNISFDKWGRTSTPEHTEITQDIFLKLYKNGYIQERTIQQLYSEESEMFLADRYVRGTCPKCGYEDARGDQCENCGSLLDPMDLIDPRSVFDNSTPVVRETTHLYIDLPAILPKLQEWMKEASVKGNWSRNAIQMTQGWIRDGLRERAITRDLKWGIPVPLKEYQDKVFYVWFDAPIGYISITATYTDKWEEWWKNPEEVELFQFIGKDNIPFHTVIFPSSLLGSGDNWTMLHHMSSSEYLNYEGGQFSKSKGIGVFGNDAKETGIPADVWRFYIFYNRPETSDFTFTWKDFQEKVNGELIGNFSNLVNRTFTFLMKQFDGEIVHVDRNEPWAKEFWEEVEKLESEITEDLEWAHLRDGLRKVFALSSYGNRVFQSAEPWKSKESDPEGTKRLLANLAYLVRDLAVLIRPYLPATAEKIGSFLGLQDYGWEQLRVTEGIDRVRGVQILFKQLEDEFVAELQKRFSGSQAERAQREVAEAEEKKEKESPEELFRRNIELRAAKIIEVERHPEADKLYIETLDDGTGEPRQIVSGLVPHYSEEELLGKTILIVSNLKPAKLRGVKSNGMLLAASDKTPEGEERVEVLFVDHAEPGERVVLEGDDAEAAQVEHLSRLKIDEFFEVPIRAEAREIMVGSKRLICAGEPVRSREVKNGTVG
ncbi:MAG: methionine--tRNA ligase, partial [Alkalispirochaetaceae bacterium]